MTTSVGMRKTFEDLTLAVIKDYVFVLLVSDVYLGFYPQDVDAFSMWINLSWSIIIGFTIWMWLAFKGYDIMERINKK